LVWELGQLSYREDELDLVFPRESIPLPALTEAEAMLAEQGVLGLSAGDHVMALYRDRLREAGILGSKDLAQWCNGRRVRVAGLLVVHQSPPTAKGFHFLTLEDEDGMMNVIVRPQVVTQTKKWPLRSSYGLSGPKLLLVEGIVQHQDNVTNILATRISPLTFTDLERTSSPRTPS
jgi:error-prone DNA polymerase